MTREFPSDYVRINAHSTVLSLRINLFLNVSRKRRQALSDRST